MALSGTISGAYRGYTLQTTWSATQSTSGNYSDITCTHKLICDSTYALYIDGRTNSCTVDGTAKSFSSSAISTGGGETITLGTTTHRVYHNADGSKSFTMTTVFNMQADIVGTWVSSITASGTITLNSIPRQAQVTGANNFNDEQNPYFTFSNAGGFQISAYLSFAGQTITRAGLGNATSGSYTFVLTDAERTLLRNATPNSNTMTVKYGLKTTISGTVYDSSINKTMTIVNANPTNLSLTYLDTNSTTTAITGNDSRIIRNKSTLRAIIGTATALKGASISSYSTTINGVTQAGNGNIDFGTINTATNTDLVLTVTDSRGNKTQLKKTVIIDDWTTPTALIELYRINNFETSSRLRVDATYSSLNSKNTITCQYCYKKTTDTTYSSWTAISNKTLTTISLDNQYDFNVKVRIADKLSGWVEASKVLAKGQPIMFIDTDKKSIGINKFPDLNYSFEVDGEGSFTGSLSTQNNMTVAGNLYANGKRVYALETGTWTPTITTLEGVAPTITYSSVTGTYCKIGKFVFVSFRVVGKITALNGANNYAMIKGLPFTPKDYTMGEQAISVGVIYDLVTSSTNLTMGINNGGIRIQNSYGAGACVLKTSSSSFQVGGSGWYEIA